MDSIDELVADVFGLPVAEVRDGLTPEDVPNWDSLNHLRLVTAIEEELGLTLSMAEIQSIDSVGRLRELIALKQQTQ